jgi:lipopolysaccharide heptosyltransferase II
LPKRRRWTPVRGEANRVYDPLERAALAALDAAGRTAFGLTRLLSPRAPQPLDPASVREVLVLRLDRIGDLIMSLPALAQLRAALPRARIRLAVGRWSQELAKSAPVDEILVWSAPWVGRPDEGAEGFATLLKQAAALRDQRLDLALELQGDVRAALLAWRSGALRRVGYANTGGRYLLTDVVALDETVSWVEQNRRAVATALGREAPAAPRVDTLTDDDRGFAQRLLTTLGLPGRGPLVAIHPSGGRRIKQWPPARWRDVAARLQEEFRATILITGTPADAELARAVQKDLPDRAIDLSGKLSLRETLAVLERVQLVLSPDTGTMHMACAVGTPTVSVFGPSDPGRYFSGGSGESGSRHVVVRADLWCAPCNLIRKPPAECAQADAPECLQLVSVEAVYREAAQLLAAKA